MRVYHIEQRMRKMALNGPFTALSRAQMMVSLPELFSDQELQEAITRASRDLVILVQRLDALEGERQKRAYEKGHHRDETSVRLLES